MGDPLDPYSVLGVRPAASILEIARARRRLARRYHPDISNQAAATVRMRQINAAWEHGLLVIEARQEQYEDKYYTSARLKTQGLREFQYGPSRRIRYASAYHRSP